jgi:serine/threonine protein kinase
VNEERRNRAKAIVRSALARSAEERSRFLTEAFRDDPTLRPEVEAMLDSYERLRTRLSSESDAVLGRKIGKYELIERVGQGAMGVVYKARDPLMRRLVAIKTMSSEIAREAELHDRFYREAQSAGTLSHKNIITIYDLGEEGSRPYIAMEFLLGEDLKSKLDRGAKLTLEERLRWMREVMEGLAHAHGKEITHRDIKPANVFVTREGEAKILDFGLARLASSVATKSGLVMGTPSYMSPEQVHGEKVDGRSDVFSAGATFYELLANRKPFPGDTIHVVFYKILETTPEPLGEIQPFLPAELVEVVEKMMAKDRAERYQSAGDALRDLTRVENALPERKRGLRVEALDAFGRVEALLRKRESLSRDEGVAPDESDKTISLPVPSPLPGDDPAEAPTWNDLLPSDLVGLWNVVRQSRAEAKRLETDIGRLGDARQRVEEAAALEAGGDVGGALAKADDALRLVPAHSSAAALVDRLSPVYASRDPKWKDARIRQLLREGEARLREGALAAAAERAERVLSLDTNNREGDALKASVAERLERERHLRAAKEQAARLVSAARTRLVDEDDLDGCLSLVGQALELNAGDSDALALKESAENRRAHLRDLAVAETAAEAIAAATLAMRRGELELAAREIERALSTSPEATEIPALTLLLERAKGAHETEIATQRRREAEVAVEVEPRPPVPAAPTRAPPPTPMARATVSRRAVDRRGIPPWLVGTGSGALVVIAAVVAWLLASSRPSDPPPEVTTTVPATSVAEVTVTVSVPPATSIPAASTTTIAPVSSTVPVRPSTSIGATTSSAPPTTSLTTTAPVTTTTVATTTATATTTAPAAAPLRPEDQIRDLMRQYRAAYENLDVAGLGAIYPAVPLSVKNSFQNFNSLTLRMEPISGPEISRSTAGPTATAVYRLVQTMEPKVGKTTVSRTRATFLFAGVGAAWIIVRVDFVPDK